jgi:hypothetical protein
MRSQCEEVILLLDRGLVLNVFLGFLFVDLLFAEGSRYEELGPAQRLLELEVQVIEQLHDD